MTKKEKNQLTMPMALKLLRSDINIALRTFTKKCVNAAEETEGLENISGKVKLQCDECGKDIFQNHYYENLPCPHCGLESGALIRNHYIPTTGIQPDEPWPRPQVEKDGEIYISPNDDIEIETVIGVCYHCGASGTWKKQKGNCPRCTGVVDFSDRDPIEWHNLRVGEVPTEFGLGNYHIQMLHKSGWEDIGCFELVYILLGIQQGVKYRYHIKKQWEKNMGLGMKDSDGKIKPEWQEFTLDQLYKYSYLFTGDYEFQKREDKKEWKSIIIKSGTPLFYGCRYRFRKRQPEKKEPSHGELADIYVKKEGMFIIGSIMISKSIVNAIMKKAFIAGRESKC